MLRLLLAEAGARALPSQLEGTERAAAAAAAASGAGPAGSQAARLLLLMPPGLLLLTLLASLKEKLRGAELTGRLRAPALEGALSSRPARERERALQAGARLRPAAPARELSSSSQAGRAALKGGGLLLPSCAEVALGQPEGEEPVKAPKAAWVPEDRAVALSVVEEAELPLRMPCTAAQGPATRGSAEPRKAAAAL